MKKQPPTLTKLRFLQRITTPPPINYVTVQNPNPNPKHLYPFLSLVGCWKI